MIFNKTISDNIQRSFIQTRLRKTNISFQKSLSPYTIQAKQTSYHPIIHRNNHKHQNPELPSKNHSHFMKCYVDKLKRQRRNLTKKLQFNPRKTLSEPFYQKQTIQQNFTLQAITLQNTQKINQFNNERVQELIKQIKKYKKSGKNLVQEILNENKKYLSTKQSRLFIPLITKVNQRQIKFNKKQQLQTHIKLQPWKSDDERQNTSLQHQYILQQTSLY